MAKLIALAAVVLLTVASATSNEINIELDNDEEQEGFNVEDTYEEVKDPCQNMYCNPGMECSIDENGKAICQCVKTCLEINDDRRLVCSNLNTTWPSDCKLHQMRCLCSEGDAACANEELKHIHIDYYGSCQEPQICVKEEMEDFPRRMREWLFNIMRDMADHIEATESFKELEKQAEEDESKKWINAAVWEWCMLDDKPTDRSVSRHELFPLRAPLYTMEHCIAPFLDSCDPDNDHKISLKEWVSCLQLDEDDIDEMEDLCDEIRPTQSK